MNLHDLVSDLIINTKGSGAGFWAFSSDSSLGAFRPELILCTTIVLLLFVRLFQWGRRVDPAWLALSGALLALYCIGPWRLLTNPDDFERMEIFTGLLVYDGFSVFIRGLLLAFLVLFILLTRLSGLPDREDGTDIFTLVLGASLGFCLMASANHLLMVFMAFEMASVPSYVMAGMMKRQRLGSEAALKYAVFGAGAAGIMLYGISLIAGIANAVHLPTVAHRLADQLPTMGTEQMLVLALACLMIFLGLAFKLSAVPAHFWCPDVFEGAPAEVGGFLSVASKAAALALLVRVAIGFGAEPPAGIEPGSRSMAQIATANGESGLYSIEETQLELKIDAQPTSTAVESDGLERIRDFMGRLIALLAAVTCTFGNLAAYGQTNIKRLLAYSTIAHAGYMMMAIPPLMAMVGVSAVGAQDAVAALAIYISVYLFMNLGAFSIVALLRNEMRSEEISDYAGLLRRCPGVAVCFSIILLSLLGLPPLSGFFGKFAVFASLTNGFQFTSQPYLIVLFIVGGINTAISLFYYLRVVRVMVVEPEPESRPEFSLPLSSLQGAFICLLTIPTAAWFVLWEQLGAMAIAATRSLLT